MTIDFDIEKFVEQYENDLSAEQVKVLPLVAFGMHAAKVSKITNISATTIRQWMRTDYRFREALSQIQKYAGAYHTAMLNQAGILAWDRVFEILETEYEQNDKVGRINQAQMAKFIIDELDVMKNRPIEEKEPDPQLHITESSADLIARRVAELQSESRAAEVQYSVVTTPDDERLQQNSMEAAQSIDGEDEIELAETEPIYPKHPSTEYGEMTINEAGTKMRCHICGNWTADMVIHLRNTHKMNPMRYREIYKISLDVKFGLTRPVEASDEDIENYNNGVKE